MTELSKNTELCISLGLLDLRSEKETEKLRQELRISLPEDAVNGFPDVDVLIQHAEEAAHLLSSSATLYLFPDDISHANTHRRELSENMENGLAVNIALHCLDDLALFCHGLIVLEENDLAVGAIADKVFDVHGRIVMQPIPYHRLVPLNELRRNFLARIDSKDHYLFPWYTEWRELDPLFFSKIADAGEEHEGVVNSILAGLRNDHPLLLDFLLNDQPFYTRLLSEAFLVKQLPQALAEDRIYHLLRLADRLAEEYSLPDAVVAAGRINSAIRVAIQDILSGKAEDVWQIPAGVYGMGLSDEQRRKVLEPYLESLPQGEEVVRKVVKKIVSRFTYIAEHGFKPRENPLADYIELLTQPDPHPLAEQINNEDMLQERDPAETIFSQINTTCSTITTILKNFLDTANGVLPEGQDQALACALGKDQDVPMEPFPLADFPSKPLPLPEPKTSTRRGTDRIEISVLTEKSLATLKQKIRAFHDISWGGYIGSEQGEKILEVRPGVPLSVELSKEDMDCNVILLGFLPVQEVLRKALKGDPESIQRVGWILYVKNGGKV